MIKPRITAALVLTLLAAVLVPHRGVDAQTTSAISPEIVEQATAVVRGSVVAMYELESNAMPYRIARIDVSDEVKGDTPASIFVATKGGQLADGTIVSVSHTPTLVTGQNVAVALIQAEPVVAASVQTGLGAGPGSVFEILYGEDGVVAEGGPVGDATFAGPNDYSFISARWSSFDPPATFKVNPNGSPLTAPVTIAAVRRAAEQWQDDPGSAIRLAYDGWTTASSASYSDGVNAISFAYLPHQSFLAQATWASTPSGQFTFDIVVNTRYNYGDQSGTGAWYDLETVVLHEFGHILGLGHVNAPSEVMHDQVPPAFTKVLGAGDRNGVGILYPAPTCNGLEPTVDLTTGTGAPTAGNDVILGTNGADVINGLGGDDVICGRGGNDTINGGDGNDTINGGDGNDTINGGGGADTINGQDGNDTIDGGGSADLIYGSTGDDTIDGNDGWDTIQGNGGSDTINGGDGNDNMNGGDGVDVIDGGSGHDLINGGDGDDDLTGGTQHDRINGQNGNDVVYGGTGQDQIWGAYGNDTLHGQDDIDWIWGGWGSDVVNGGAGNDRLYGEGHNDWVYGNAGNDHLNGGMAADTCDGGPGADTDSDCENSTNTP